MRGSLIVFEGLDRSGKSTQCARLAEHLKDTGRKVIHLRFPDRTTPIGTMIDNYLKGGAEHEDHAIHLLFSANRWERVPYIETEIANGTIVVIDRYYYSGCVYSAAKDNPLLDLTWARHPEVGLPRPDLCVFLNISSEVAAKRGDYGEERYESLRMQTRVRELFDQLQKSAERDDFVVINADDSMDAVAQTVFEVVGKTLQLIEQQSSPIRRVQPW